MLSKADRDLFIINEALCIWPDRSSKPQEESVGTGGDVLSLCPVVESEMEMPLSR